MSLVLQKGVPMGVAVILDLNDEVSVPDLKHFLSFVPEGYAETLDLRLRSVTGGAPQFLAIDLTLSK